ncbi:HNH endonuclease [Aurantiacibacter sp. D1-12]|uniref:HNH endonuclease n=1 Tax=Aurantiacibacter sp. D1-12 TaxID=2993658 RepID=UPI00237D168D|nr:HNH endonuclease [Aurantiacibacter sp. D1-12]MDE1467337.1 HNH endonuclease [Aurantiacibacter sp. D1-12]
MAGANWSESVEFAVRRLAARHDSAVFSRQQLIEEELDRIVRETGSRGATPAMTLSRELQQMRDAGHLKFEGSGNYRLVGGPVELPNISPSRCVFLSGEHSPYGDKPELYYRFGQRHLSAASRSVGQWIIYQRPRRAGGPDYFAVARVEQIVRDPSDRDSFLALIEPETYCEFGRRVPYRVTGEYVESGLLGLSGSLSQGRARASIRDISLEDFNRILDLGMLTEDELLPREDELDSPLIERLNDKAEAWDGPVDRATVLTERKVRDRQFRARVLAAYECTCALTGMRLINGGGRAETQAAHIWSVKEGGPDTVSNGLALSGTVHWMFDRGLVSLSDDGEILLSHKINDFESVEKLLFPDRRARFPSNERARPDPKYLAWHREWHGIAA